jgi:lactose/L-arabinose transport system substrate-binding protein
MPRFKTAKGWSLCGLLALLGGLLLAACSDTSTATVVPTTAPVSTQAAATTTPTTTTGQVTTAVPATSTAPATTVPVTTAPAATATANPTPTPKPALKGEISVWAWDNAARSLQANIAGFNQLYPEVKVKVQEINRLEVYAKLTAGLTGGGVGLPDVITLESERLEAFVTKFPEGLANLTDKAAPYEKDFDPVRWSKSNIKSRIRALPWDVGPTGLFYRVDMFEKANIDPNSIETWDDFIEAGKKIQAANPGVKMVALDSTSDDALFRMILNQQGAYYFTKDGTISLASPEAIYAMTVIQKLKAADLLLEVDSRDSLVSANKNGLVATQPSGVWWSGTLRQTAPELSGKWDVMLLPATTRGGNRAASLGGSTLAIPSKTKNFEAAWAFIEYCLTTRAGQNNAFKNFGLMPAYLPARSDPFYTAPQPYFNDKPIWEIFTAEIPRIKPMTFTVDNPLGQAAAIEAQTQVLSGADPKTALQKAADELRQKTGRDRETS